MSGVYLEGSAGSPGTLVWNATEGKLQLFVSPVYKSLSIQVSSAGASRDVEPTLSGTVTLAVPIPRCSDGVSPCEIWKLGYAYVGIFQHMFSIRQHTYYYAYAAATETARAQSGRSRMLSYALVVRMLTYDDVC